MSHTCLGVTVAWASGIVAAGSMGCARTAAEPVPLQPIYVRLAELVRLHPAYGLTEATARSWPRLADKVGIPQTRPVSAIRPFGVLDTTRRRTEADGSHGSKARVQQLTARLNARVDKYEARQIRLDYARLESERDWLRRETEEQFQQVWSRLRAQTQRRLRTLDLRIIALENQVGSLAAGPPDQVEAALRNAREERRRIEAEFASESSRLRNELYQAQRARLEELETALTHQREQEIGALRAEASATVRRYEATVTDWAGDLDSMHIPDTKPIWPAGVVSRLRLGRTRVSFARWPEAKPRMAAQDILQREVVAAVHYLAARRGWRIVTEPQRGVADRTEAMARMLTDFWYGQLAE